MIVIQATLMYVSTPNRMLPGAIFYRMYLINENRRRDKRSEATVIADEGNQHHILETDLMVDRSRATELPIHLVMKWLK